MFRRKDDDIVQDLLGNAEVTETKPSDNKESGKKTTDNTGSSDMTESNKQQESTANTSPYARGSNAQAGDTTRGAAPAPASPFRTASDYNRGRTPAPAASNTARDTASVSPKASNGSRRVLTVGHDILLKGEIATCDRLVIEGAVDATLNEVHTVEIAESGSFKGAAEIEDAEISGVFEGDLIVRNRLVIYSTGKVNGKITYGEIEIERGGELRGEIKTIDSAGSTAKTASKAKEKEAVAA